MKLKDNGWTEKEIKRVEHILDKERDEDTQMSNIIFWTALFVIIFANILISVVLIPFLVAFNPSYLYVVVVVLGGMIGFLYKFLITNSAALQKKHHLTAGIIIPIVAIANLITMVIVANRFSADLNLPPQNPWIVSLLFAAAFILPYLIAKIRSR